jgi:hypothetical protein
MDGMWARRAVAAAALSSAAALVGAPGASAAGADAVITDLQAQGYIVHINWLTGFDTKPLSQCTVTNINNPDHSGAPMQLGDAVYVDVRCPNHDDEFGDFGIGVGIG